MDYMLTNSVALVRERTIPTERPPLVGEVSANVCYLHRKEEFHIFLHSLVSSVKMPTGATLVDILNLMLN
jgi:hypothetical protein